MVRTEVLIIGGGATGSGIARDLALRGREVMLLEKGDFCSGASGRNHGLLHSGARYAMSDPSSARECAKENKILKKIAPWHIEDTGGLFIDLEGGEYIDKFLSACRRCGIATTETSVSEALSMEPSLTREMLAAVGVEDASLDPFGLVQANIEDARKNGASAKNYCQVIALKKEAGQIVEATYREIDGKIKRVKPEVVVSACGAGSTQMAALGGIGCEVRANKGSMVILNGRLVNGVVNRLRPPSNGDIVLPHHSSSIIGTTSSDFTGEEVVPSREEVELLIRETALLVPDIARSRAIRAYSGLRPLLPQKEGRCRDFQVIDQSLQGVDNFLLVMGGKLTTYRLMAEKASDLVLRKLGIKGDCRTHLAELPGKELRPRVQDDLICSCEKVSWGQLQQIASSPDIHNGADLMRRTRVGMGFCQSALCAFKVSFGLGEKAGQKETEKFLSERWKGIEPAVSGEQLKQEVFKAYLFRTYGVRYPPEEGG